MRAAGLTLDRRAGSETGEGRLREEPRKERSIEPHHRQHRRTDTVETHDRGATHFDTDAFGVSRQSFHFEEMNDSGRRRVVLLVIYVDWVVYPPTELRGAFEFVGLAIARRSFDHMNTVSVRRDPDAVIDPSV